MLLCCVMLLLGIECWTIGGTSGAVECCCVLLCCVMLLLSVECLSVGGTSGVVEHTCLPTSIIRILLASSTIVIINVLKMHFKLHECLYI